MFLFFSMAIISTVPTWLIYINATQRMANTDANKAAGSFAGDTLNLFIGRKLGTNDTSPNMSVDEIGYWKGTFLDSAAVTALYNAGSGRFLESV